MAAPSTAQTGMPVTVVTDDQSTVVPATVPASEKAGKPVTEVPTPGAADDH